MACGKIGWSVHATHLLLSAINFAIIVVVVFWAVSKFVPGVLHNRNASIQRALKKRVLPAMKPIAA